MLKNTFLKHKRLFMVGIALYAACADDAAGGTHAAATTTLTTAEQAQARVLSLHSGQVVKTVQTTKDARPLWQVSVKNTAGATLSFQLFGDDGSVQQIGDRAGPLTYDLAIIEGVMSLSEARAKAQTYHAGEPVAWKLQREDDGSWEYEVYLRDAASKLFEVKMTGNGEFKEKEEKAEVDAF